MGTSAAIRLRRAAGSGLVLVAGLLLFWACLQPPISLHSSGRDGGSDGGTAAVDGGSPAILGLFTISGCADLSFPDGNPHCIGTAPLNVRLILLAVGATMHRFQVTRVVEVADGGTALPDGGSGDGGTGSDSLLDDVASRSDSPSLLLSGPGAYVVTLGVAGPGGTATAVGQITVLSARLGASCDSDSECDPGLTCFCRGASGGDLGSRCPGGLGAGVCTRSCSGSACPAGSSCVDVSRSLNGVALDGGVGSSDPWRQPLCMPTCSLDSDCRSDLLCRELPLLSSGAMAGGAYVWGRACFASTPGGVGASCIGGDEKPAPTSCAFGLCEPLGLRDLCSAPCDVACPTSAACANFTGPPPPAPVAPRCVARCDLLHPCTDPLLACQGAVSTGALGFKLPSEPPGTTVCTPKRCSAPADCPGGRCVALSGASFCTR